MDPIRLVKEAIPEDMPIKVTEILPRLKDGGAFVKFQYPATMDPVEIECTHFKRPESSSRKMLMTNSGTASLTNKLKETPLKPWFSPFRAIQAKLVRGTPWLEDLYRFPSSIVKVEFVPTEPGTTPEKLSEEILYSLFRRYAKIAEILPQPADSKETPQFAQLWFPTIRDAIMARNCMHGYVVNEAQGGGKSGTLLRLSYVKRAKGHSIWNWLTSHPRIVFPIVAALLAGFSVIIFDPIRQFFIKLHVHHSLDFSESRVYKWFKSHRDTFTFGHRRDHGDNLRNVWDHRKEVISQLDEWIGETSDNFIIVTGPKGTGKVELLMNKALENRKDVLLIDCKPIVEARGETSKIKHLAQAVGYRPVFLWANSVSSLIDLAVQSTTGVKAGFSENFDSQLNKILYTAATALKQVALCERSKKDKDANLSDDAYLEAHPEQRPVVVIDNFLHKAEDQAIIYDKISEWAASMVQNSAAQVVFLTSDPSYTKLLSKALPDRVFRVVALGDLDPEIAKNFVTSRLEDDQNDRGKEDGDEKRIVPNIHGLEASIETLGGRLVDLESLARRVRAGQSPRQATEEIVGESATDIVKMFLLGKTGDEIEKRWSTQQVWQLIKALSKEPTLRYNQVLLTPTFASSLTSSAANGEAALESLAAAELIAIKSSRGHPKVITAGKTLHQAAFAVLANDRVLCAKMDLAVLNEHAKIEAKGIDSAENELALLGSLPRQTGESAGRIQYLLTKLDVGQRKIVQLEKEIAERKKILNEEY